MIRHSGVNIWTSLQQPGTSKSTSISSRREWSMANMLKKFGHSQVMEKDLAVQSKQLESTTWDISYYIIRVKTYTLDIM